MKAILINKDGTVIQLVRDNLHDELSCIILRDSDLTKEEQMYSLMSREVDKDGLLFMPSANKDLICEAVGISIEVYHNYISRWKKSGLVWANGKKWLGFKIYVKPTAVSIAITTNGMMNITNN